jgi:hypothetical protein
MKSKLTKLSTLLFLAIPFFGIAQTITATRLPDNATTTYTCDGVDDHIEINQALDYIKNSGGTVTLSADTFYIDEPILLAGNHTTLEGAGMDLTTIKLIDDAGWCYYYSDGNGGWLYQETDPLISNKPEAVRYLSIKNLKINGNKYNQSLYNPITGETIQNTPTSHVFDGQGHYVGIEFKKREASIETVTNINFINVFVYENSDDGIVVHKGENITIQGCKGIRGGHSHVYFLDPKNLLVENCEFMVTANSGIRWYDGNHIVLRNNYIYGEPEKTGNSNFCIQMTGGQTATITDDLIIENNRLEFTAGAGIALDAKNPTGAKDVIIRNNTILQCGNSGTTENMREAGGINIKNFTNTLIENNTIVNCIGGGIRLGGNVGFNTQWAYIEGLTATIKNNIVTNTIEGGNSTASGYGIDIASGNSAICTFNNVWGNAEGNYFGCEPDLGSLSVDPLFKSITLGTAFSNTNDINADLHLQSELGRWNDTTNTWETDANSSMCINGGNPDDNYANEPANNGARLNLGAYGNTAFASKGTKAPPVANAGVDQYIRDDNGDGIVFVTLDGTQSTDNGTITNYSWKRSGAEISTLETQSVAFVLGAVTVTLDVIDDDGISSSDSVFIKVLPYGSNMDPIADASNDITKTDNNNDGLESVTLDASNSHDADAIITSYVWTEDGSEIATGVSPQLDFLVGEHNVTLTVTDNEGATNTDDILIKIRPKGNYALEFSNDFNDEVIITNNLTFYETFTIEMWVKQTATTDDAALLWLGDDGKRIILKTASSFPSWDESTNNTASENISLNQWHHLAFVVDNSSLTNIYIDGVLSAITSPQAIGLPTDFNIGTFYGSTDTNAFNFVGIMDEIRYWNTVRTASEINANKNIELIGNEIGLKAYWNFNDGSGKRLSDKSGIADGTLFNMEDVDWVTDTPFGNTAAVDTVIEELFLFNIYPNPTKTNATIDFKTNINNNVKLEVFNVLGNKVDEIINNNLNIGNHSINYNTSKLSNGFYVFKLTIGNQFVSKKIIINK